MVLSTPTSWTSTWPRSHYLVILLLIYSVPRRKCSSLHDDTLGITPGIPLCGTIAIGLEMNPKFRRFQEVGFAFSYIVLHV